MRLKFSVCWLRASKEALFMVLWGCSVGQCRQILFVVMFGQGTEVCFGLFSVWLSSLQVVMKSSVMWFNNKQGLFQAAVIRRKAFA